MEYSQASARTQHESTKTKPISSCQRSPSLRAHFNPATKVVQSRPSPRRHCTCSCTHPPPPTAALIVRTRPSPQPPPPTNSTITHVTLPCIAQRRCPSPSAIMYRLFSRRRLFNTRGHLQYGRSGRPLDQARLGECYQVIKARHESHDVHLQQSSIDGLHHIPTTSEI
jgi:hypothetical protein